MLYNIVSVQLSHPSFSWGNGLYAVIERNDNEIRLCKIGEDGKPQTYRDGRLMLSATGVNNKEVYPTPLKLEYES